jgi:hypothetical protein
VLHTTAPHSKTQVQNKRYLEIDNARRTIVVADRIGVASRAREVVARVAFPLFDFVEALNGQLIPFVRE